MKENSFTPPEINFEKGPEHIPSQEEVLVLFERFVNGEYKITNEIKDEQGLCLLVVETAGKLEGETTESMYSRKGYGKTEHTPGSLETVIYVVFYDKEGIPYSGTSLANLVNSEWVDC